MEILYDLVKSIAIIGVIMGFIQILLPNGSTKSSVKLVFGLIFIAVMINPIIHVFTDVNLLEIDFSNIEIADIDTDNNNISNEQLFAIAEASISKEISNYIEKKYDGITADVAIKLNDDGISSAKVELSKTGNIAESKDKINKYVRNLLISEYEANSNEITIVNNWEDLNG